MTGVVASVATAEAVCSRAAACRYQRFSVDVARAGEALP